MAMTTDELPAVDLTADAALLIDGLRAIQAQKQKVLDEQVAPLDALIENLRGRLQELLGEAEIGRLDGKDVVTWKRTSEFDDDAFRAEIEPEIVEAFLRPKIDVSYLKRMRPDLHYRFSRPSKSTRRFTLVDPE